MQASAEDVSEILRRVLSDGRLRKLPRNPRRRNVLLAVLCAGLRRRHPYTEPELNAAVQRWLTGMDAEMDHVTCRRYLVDLGFVRRDRAGARYIVNYPRVEATLSREARDSAGDLLEQARRRLGKGARA